MLDSKFDRAEAGVSKLGKESRRFRQELVVNQAGIPMPVGSMRAGERRNTRMGMGLPACTLRATQRRKEETISAHILVLNF